MSIQEIRRIAVVGAGSMGHGIGLEFALAGHPVFLHDLSTEKLQQAVQGIERSLRQLAAWGLVVEEEIGHALGRIETSVQLSEAVAEADLVVEAVFERLDVKLQVFRELDALCPPRTILASNTSTHLPSVLAAATRRPGKVLVAHYFYPPLLLPLVEIVPSKGTDPQTVTSVYELMKAIGKSPIVVQKEACGFIANRLQFALQREALAIVEQGIATAQDVDIAVRDGFGRRLAVAGPFEIAEPIGWDLELQIQRYLLPHLENSPEPSRLLIEKVDRGELGMKSGRGFYAWTRQSEEAWRARMSRALARIASVCQEQP